MATLLTEQTIHMVDCDPDVADAIFCMMDTMKYRVRRYKNGEDFLNSKNLKNDDVLIVELDERHPEMYTLVNELLYMATRPGVILICRQTNSIKSTDLFPSGRIEILYHPFGSDKLKSAIGKLT